ncbi:hypothetical protein [Actinomycetospora lemnae]|uniref:Uncharacterized protein n=1 Tax=Actinomycetospora lemnae TaxID=3019891 RepID=A0ABT5SQ96_9PSEU|nr:hypothetical protein [Actinomycetospora sp. DW7H6]MDD7964989.1 hypothetical protein [Actinomycetospora sp. DW7H6]
MTAASTRGRAPRPARFTFWVDRAGTLGPVLLRYDLRGSGTRRGARLGVLTTHRVCPVTLRHCRPASVRSLLGRSVPFR